jgi:hypothetical protein
VPEPRHLPRPNGELKSNRAVQETCFDIAIQNNDNSHDPAKR